MGAIKQQQATYKADEVRRGTRPCARSAEAQPLDGLERQQAGWEGYSYGVGEPTSTGRTYKGAATHAGTPISPAAFPAGGVLYPLWVPSYIVHHRYPAYPSQKVWKPHNPRPAKHSAGLAEARAPPMTGTGVFLPATAVTEHTGYGTAQQHSCSESDGDSADSASDCLALDESAPIRHGKLANDIPIELLLPEEWEY